MKLQGVVSKLDNLGRILIPKEIRRTLKMEAGDPIEICVSENREITLKKYSRIKTISAILKDCADILHDISGHTVYIVDTDKVVVARMKGSVKQVYESVISVDLEKLIRNCGSLVTRKGEEHFIPILEDDEVLYKWQLIIPIIHERDKIGAIVMLSSREKLGEVEIELTHMAVKLINKYLD